MDVVDEDHAGEGFGQMERAGDVAGGGAGGHVHRKRHRAIGAGVMRAQQAVQFYADLHGMKDSMMKWDADLPDRRVF